MARNIVRPHHAWISEGGSDGTVPSPDAARYVIIQAQPPEYNAGGAFVSTSDQLASFVSGGSQANFNPDATHGARIEFTQSTTGTTTYNGQWFTWTGRSTKFLARAGFTFYDAVIDHAKFFCGLSTGVNDVAGGFSLIAFHVEKLLDGPPIQTFHCVYWVNNVIVTDIDSGIAVGVLVFPASPVYHDFKITIDSNVASFSIDGMLVAQILITTPLAMGVFYGGGGTAGNTGNNTWGLEYAYLQNATL